MNERRCIICTIPLQGVSGNTLSCSALCREEHIRQKDREYYANNRDAVNRRNADSNRRNNSPRRRAKRTARQREYRKLHGKPWKIPRDRKCVVCQTPFTAKHGRQLTCDAECREDHTIAQLKLYRDRTVEKRKAYDKSRVKTEQQKEAAQAHAKLYREKLGVVLKDKKRAKYYENHELNKAKRNKGYLSRKAEIKAKSTARRREAKAALAAVRSLGIDLTLFGLS